MFALDQLLRLLDSEKEGIVERLSTTPSGDDRDAFGFGRLTGMLQQVARFKDILEAEAAKDQENDV